MWSIAFTQNPARTDAALPVDADHDADYYYCSILQREDGFAPRKQEG